MILNWMQKMGAAKTALAITVISILGALALEIGMSLISGQMHPETIIKCIIFPGIIAPIVSYAVVRVAIRLAESDAALRESEVKYSQLVNHAPVGIYEVDYIEGKFVSVNDVICEYTGYTRQELLSMSALDILTEDSQKKFLGRMHKIFKGQKVPSSVEFKIRAKTGHEFRVLINSSMIYAADGRPKGATVVVHDITEQKQAEEEKKNLEYQLQQAQKMEAIGTLAGGIAHDFNNILSVIIGYTELILMNANVDAEVRQNLKEVFNASKHARDMVKQILAFSRQNKQERKPIQVAHIAKEAIKMLRASLPATISIQQHIEKDTGVIEADPTQIHQVLMNLCTNAGTPGV